MRNGYQREPASVYMGRPRIAGGMKLTVLANVPGGCAGLPGGLASCATVALCGVGFEACSTPIGRPNRSALSSNGNTLGNPLCKPLTKQSIPPSTPYPKVNFARN